MNNIGLIISGNLTGFSRFYASPNANDIYNEAKFDFDYRNFLTFLNNDDKVYAISFAPAVISVSLVTRILDSFRRPGVLVVSILLPRNKKVESAMNAQNNKALYQLLNAIHDTFHEKNFINGMVNQNAAVLMQDYYTDILSSFVLVPDGLQRPINSRIDVSSPNKRLGYVKSTEDNVPLYLSSLCRKNYEGYHHIFIAGNAPQNIDEEPVEVVSYSVKVTNSNLRLQNVKLTDKIYNLHPEEGEIDIEKNFTYQQVVNGEAGRNLVASIVNDTIEITYRFGKETREIKFSFIDGTGNPVTFASVSPRVVFSNGDVVNINNEVWSFEGKEIYDRKTIESGNSNFTIKRDSANLDIKRLKNGSECLIQVEQSFPVNISFSAPSNKPKRMTFIRKNGERKVFEFEGYLNVVLPGKVEEYTYVIESNYYEKVTGQLPPLGTPKINLRAKVEHSGSFTTLSSSASHRADINPQKTSTSVRGGNHGQALKLEGNNNANTKLDNNVNNKKIVLAGVFSVLLVAIVVTFALYDKNIRELFNGVHDNTPEVEAYNDNIDRDLIISFKDADGDFVMSDNISFDVFTRIVNIYVSQKENIEKTDSTVNGIFNWTYHVSGSASDLQELSIVCSVGSSIINEECVVKAERLLPDSTSLNDGLRIKLKVRTSEIKLYKELPEIIENGGVVSKSDYDKLDKRIKKIALKDFADPLKEMFKHIKYDEPKKINDEIKVTTTPPGNPDNSSNPDKLSDDVYKYTKMVTAVPGSICDFLPVGPKETIKKYNKFIKSNQYKNFSYEIQSDFKVELEKTKTYGGIAYLIKEYSKK